MIFQSIRNLPAIRFKATIQTLISKVIQIYLFIYSLLTFIVIYWDENIFDFLLIFDTFIKLCDDMVIKICIFIFHWTALALWFRNNKIIVRFYQLSICESMLVDLNMEQKCVKGTNSKYRTSKENWRIDSINPIKYHK